jgi:PAS domain S-box-containing protein
MSLGQAFLGQRYAAILERKLALTSHRYRLFFDGVKDYALLTVDRDHRVTSWNIGAERLFGYREAEIIGQNYSRLLEPGSAPREEVRKSMVDADRLGWVECEGWRVRKDGTRFLCAGVLAAMAELYHGLSSLPRTRSIRTSSVFRICSWLERTRS